MAPVIVNFIVTNKNIRGAKSNLDLSQVHMMRNSSNLVIIHLLSLANHKFCTSHENYDVFNLMFNLQFRREKLFYAFTHLRVNKEVHNYACLGLLWTPISPLYRKEVVTFISWWNIFHSKDFTWLVVLQLFDIFDRDFSYTLAPLVTHKCDCLVNPPINMLQCQRNRLNLWDSMVRMDNQLVEIHFWSYFYGVFEVKHCLNHCFLLFHVGTSHTFELIGIVPVLVIALFHEYFYNFISLDHDIINIETFVLA